MSDIAQDLGGVVRLLEKATDGRWYVEPMGENEFEQLAYSVNMDDGRIPTVESGVFYGDPHDANAACAAVNFLRAHSAEIAGAFEQLRDLHDSIRAVYDAVPALPITADTMDAATDALHAFCLLVGTHRVDVGDPQPPAMQQGGGGGEAAA